MKGISQRLSYANVTVTLLIFMVLGGTALAATLGKNSVGSREIERNAVKVAEIAKDAVRASEVRDGEIGAAELEDGGVGTAEIADQSVTAADLAPGAGGIASESNPGIQFAVVAADGTLVRGSSSVTGTDIVNLANNTYRVSFALDVSACSYTATPQGSSSDDTPAVEPSANPNSVRIDMDNPSGFHLQVICQP